MHVIRVSYRAEFTGMKKGPLNLLGAKVNVPIGIEFYESTGGHWKFRAPHNGVDISELGACVGLENAKKRAAQQFDKLTKEWIMIGDTGAGRGRRELKPQEYMIREGRVYVYEQEAKDK